MVQFRVFERNSVVNGSHPNLRLTFYSYFWRIFSGKYQIMEILAYNSFHIFLIWKFTQVQYISIYFWIYSFASFSCFYIIFIHLERWTVQENFEIRGQKLWPDCGIKPNLEGGILPPSWFFLNNSEMVKAVILAFCSIQ